MSLFTKINVRPGTQCVEYVRGTFNRVLDPGRHRRRFRATYVAVSTRDQLVTIAPQDVPTADGLTVRVTAAIRWAVGDARAYVEVAAQPYDVVHLAVQVALRDLLVSVDAGDAAAEVRRSGPARALAAATFAGAGVGIAVRDVVVKDVVLPVELRAAQAELVTARTRGLAELEKARAETAALRSLANAAKMLDDNPALARIRLVQALPHGSTLELSVSTES
jgi:regulator of protease activity HflC (stomatin/prohibitin superfamily)